MGQQAKWEYFQAIYERYRQADRKRKHAMRLLNGPPRAKQRAARAHPATRAGPNRERCWETGKPQSKRPCMMSNARCRSVYWG
jgi:hypothetical protein